MSNTIIVKIICEKKLYDILVNGESLDISGIADMPVEAWFAPAKNRSGWQGLIKEIREFASDEKTDLAFEFQGDVGQKAIFFNCLDKNNIRYVDGPSAEELAENRIRDARKEEARGHKEEALRLFELASALGNTEAKFQVAEYYLHEIGYDASQLSADKKKSEALDLYLELAEQGDVRAMRRIAECYQKGLGTEADESGALKWLNRAADAGDEDAARELEDIKIAQAEREAKALREAEEKGRREAARIEAELKATEEKEREEKSQQEKNQKITQSVYSEDVKDPLIAEFMQQRALAFNGDVSAQYKVGRCFLDGRGCNKDSVSAYYWLDKAASSGHKMAMYYVGVCYEYGWGVDRNKWKAIEYYKKSGVSEAKDALTRINKVNHIAKAHATVTPIKPKKDGMLGNIAKKLRKKK